MACISVTFELYHLGGIPALLHHYTPLRSWFLVPPIFVPFESRSPNSALCLRSRILRVRGFDGPDFPAFAAKLPTPCSAVIGVFVTPFRVSQLW